MRLTSTALLSFVFILSAIGCFDSHARDKEADSGSSDSVGRDVPTGDSGSIDPNVVDVGPRETNYRDAAVDDEEAEQAGSGGTASTGRDWGTVWDDAADGRSPSECNEIANAIAAEVPGGYCTAIVRYDYETLEHLGHSFVCQPNATNTDEVEAREAIGAAMMFIDSRLGEGEFLPSAEDDPVWVFYQQPSDLGGVAAVSKRTGLTVFAGSMIFGGNGQIVIPPEWYTTDLGDGCVPLQEPLGSITGFDLRAGWEMDEPEPARLVLESVLPTIWKQFGGDSGPPVVLFYVPTAATEDMMSKAEYVVIINGHTAAG